MVCWLRCQLWIMYGPVPRSWSVAQMWAQGSFLVACALSAWESRIRAVYSEATAFRKIGCGRPRSNCDRVGVDDLDLLERVGHEAAEHVRGAQPGHARCAPPSTSRRRRSCSSGRCGTSRRGAGGRSRPTYSALAVHEMASLGMKRVHAGVVERRSARRRCCARCVSEP